jgi:hypothetical protein
MRARPLGDDPDLPGALVAEAGQAGVLLLHLALPAPSTPAGEIGDAEWRRVFAHRVDPMARLVAAVLPQRVARGRGRRVSAEEDTLAACLCGDAAACFVGPVFAVSDLSAASS